MQAQLDTEAQLLQEISDNPGVIRTYLEGMVPSLLSFLVQVIVAIIVLLIGSRIIKFLLKLIKKSLDRSKVEAGVVTFLCSLVKYSLYFVLAMIILAQFGVTTSSVVAVLGSAGSTAGFGVATCYPKSGICKKSPFGSFYDFCPLKLRQWRFGCSPEHRMRPSDFVSALMDVRRNRAAAGATV